MTDPFNHSRIEHKQPELEKYFIEKVLPAVASKPKGRKIQMMVDPAKRNKYINSSYLGEVSREERSYEAFSQSYKTLFLFTFTHADVKYQVFQGDSNQEFYFISGPDRFVFTQCCCGVY